MADPQPVKSTCLSRAELVATLDATRGQINTLLNRHPDGAGFRPSVHLLPRSPVTWTAGAFFLGLVASVFLFRRQSKSSLAARVPLAKIAIRDLALPLVLTVARPWLQRLAEQRLAPHLER